MANIPNVMDVSATSIAKIAYASALAMARALSLAEGSAGMGLCWRSLCWRWGVESEREPWTI